MDYPLTEESKKKVFSATGIHLKWQKTFVLNEGPTFIPLTEESKKIGFPATDGVIKSEENFLCAQSPLRFSQKKLP